MLRDRLRRALVPLVSAAILCGPAGAVQLGLSEGTNLAVTVDPAGEHIVLDLYGRLWRMPASGGLAEALTGPEYRLRRPAIGPDGRIVAVGGPGDGQHLWLADDGGTLRQLTTGEGRDDAPQWQPDGQHVVFASDRAGSWDLHEIDIDTGTVTRLTRTNTDEIDPAVSPSGRLLAWITRTRTRWEVWLREGDGPPRLVYSAEQRLSAPSIRPDDGVILLVEEAPEGSRMMAVILSDPPVAKAVATGEDFFRRPAVWMSRTRYLYTSDGRIRLQRFGEFRRRDIPFTAWISAVGPPGTADELETDLPPLHHGRYVLRTGRLFDGEHAQYQHSQDVLVVDDRVATISGRRDWGDTPIIDFADATLMPGLIRLGFDALADGAEGHDLLGCGVTTVVGLPATDDGSPVSPPPWNDGSLPGPALITARRDTGGLLDVRRIADRRTRLEQIRRGRSAGMTVITNRLYPDLAAGASLIADDGELPRSPSGRQYADIRRLLAASGASRLSREKRADHGADPRSASEAPCEIQRQLREAGRDGLPPFLALRRHGAEMARLAGLGGHFGTITERGRADLLVVAGDPLADIRDAGNLLAVVVGGRFFTPAGLTALDREKTSENLTESGDSGEMSPNSDTFNISGRGSIRGGWPTRIN